MSFTCPGTKRVEPTGKALETAGAREAAVFAPVEHLAHQAERLTLEHGCEQPGGSHEQRGSPASRALPSWTSESQEGQSRCFPTDVDRLTTRRGSALEVSAWQSQTSTRNQLCQRQEPQTRLRTLSKQQSI